MIRHKKLMIFNDMSLLCFTVSTHILFNVDVFVSIFPCYCVQYVSVPLFSVAFCALICVTYVIYWGKSSNEPCLFN
jgi:hypothetical protein